MRSLSRRTRVAAAPNSFVVARSVASASETMPFRAVPVAAGDTLAGR